MLRGKTTNQITRQFFSKTNQSKIIVVDLREALSKRGLSTDGLKADLVNRLQARLDEEEFGMIDMGIATPSVDPTPAPAPVQNSIPTPAPVEDATVTNPPSSTALQEITQGTAKEAMETTESEPKNMPTSAEAITTDSSKIVNSTPETKQKSPLPTTSTKSLEEKKKERAARFGIPLVPKKTNDNSKSVGSQSNKKHLVNSQSVGSVGSKTGGNTKETLSEEEILRRIKRAKKFGTDAEKDSMQYEHLKKAKRAKRFQTGAKDEISHDEILRRIKRAEKFGTGDLDDLKKELRKHRFSS